MPSDESTLLKQLSKPTNDRVLIYTGILLLAVALLWTLLG